MISLSESGLSSANYAALLAAVDDPSLQVVLEQYSLSLTSHDSSGHASVLDSFDAIVCDDVIVRAYRSAANEITIQTLATEDGGDQAWSAKATLTATAISATVPVTLATDGSANVRVFYYDATAEEIEYFANAAKGVGNAASWGATTLCLAVADVEQLAAVALTRVHYTRLTSSNNRRLWVVIDDGGWAATGSSVYWPTPIDSFDAVAGNQVDDEAAAVNDVIVFSTYFPHIIGRKIENTKLVYTITQVQGIAVIRYQNGRWSDHVAIDVVDEAPSFPSRSDVRVSNYGGYHFLTYYRVDGTETYSHTAIALSRSKDGLRWELPYLLPASIDAISILLKRGDHAYLLNAKDTYRSISCGYTADCQNTQDITQYVVNRATRAGDIQQLQLTMANPEQVLDVTTPFSSDVTLQVRVKDGYWVGGSELLVQTLLADVEAIGGNLRLPQDHVSLQGRDKLARLLTLRADQVNEWESQAIGGDDFESADETAYSGMRHTAVQEGHWKTEDNELFIVPNEAPCFATNTYVSDAQNGSCQAGIQVADTESEDYAGLTFRAYDKHNNMYAAYRAEEDTIRLYSRQDNSDTLVTESAAMSWTHSTWYYLKIRFRYGYVWVYSSTDGIVWTERIATEVSGVPTGTSWTWANFSPGLIPNLSGRMGYIAHGYSDEQDEYTPPPPPPPNGGGEDPPEQDQWYAGLTAGFGAAYTNDIFGAANSQIWTFENEGLPTVGWKTIYDFKLWHWPDGRVSLFATTGCGIAEYRYLPMPGGKWYPLVDLADLATAVGSVNAQLVSCRMRFSIERQGYAYVGFYTGSSSPYKLNLARTEDYWQTVAAAHTYAGTCNANAYGSKVDVAQHSDASTVYLAGLYDAWSYGLVKSTTYGSSLTLKSSTYGRAVHVPYGSASWDDSLVYAAGGVGIVAKSEDGGDSWAVMDTIGGETVGLSTPTYDRNLLCLSGRYGFYEWVAGAFVEFANWSPQQSQSSWMVERDENRRAVYWLNGSGSGTTPYIRRSDGGMVEITGSIRNIGACLVTALAGYTHEAVP